MVSCRRSAGRDKRRTSTQGSCELADRVLARSLHYRHGLLQKPIYLLTASQFFFVDHPGSDYCPKWPLDGELLSFLYNELFSLIKSVLLEHTLENVKQTSQEQTALH